MSIEYFRHDYYLRISIKYITINTNICTFWVIIIPPNQHITSPLVVTLYKKNTKKEIISHISKSFGKCLKFL